MQFRKVKFTTQCLVAYWDEKNRRSRQKLVFSYSNLGVTSPRKPTADELADFGTQDEREAWATEISHHIDASIQDANIQRTRNSILRLQSATDRITADLAEKRSVLTDEDIKAAHAALKKLARSLGMTVARKQPKSASKTSSKGTDNEK